MAENVNISDLAAVVLGHVVCAYWEGLLTKNWAYTSKINWWKSSK